MELLRCWLTSAWVWSPGKGTGVSQEVKLRPKQRNRERGERGHVWVQFLWEAAPRRAMTACFTESGLGPCLSDSRIKKKEGLCCNVTRCDISAGLWGALRQNTGGFDFIRSHTTLMGCGYPRVCKQVAFCHHNTQGRAHLEMLTNAGSHCWGGGVLLHEGIWVGSHAVH